MSRGGSLSRQWSRGGGIRKPRRVNRDPLRRVVRTVADPESGFPREELECGHLIVPPRDFIGETIAARRRCWRCARENEKKEEDPR